MSIEALNWALSQKTGSPAAKSVLLILANRAGHDGKCWPGIDGIAKQTELAERTVIRHIQGLAADGFICIVHRGGTGEGRKSNMYQLHLGAKCQSCTLGQSDTDDRQYDTVSGLSDTLSPEPSYNPKKNPKTNGHSVIAGFERWWDEYPKKVKKKTALDIWKRKHPDADLLIADVRNRVANDSRWKGGFVPDPTTYLNGERWDDEVSTETRNEANNNRSESFATIHARVRQRAGLD